MPRKILWRTAFLVLLMTTLNPFPLVAQEQPGMTSKPDYGLLRRFRAVMNVVQKNFVTEVSDAHLVEGPSRACSIAWVSCKWR